MAKKIINKMFFSVVTKNLKQENSTKNLVTFSYLITKNLVILDGVVLRMKNLILWEFTEKT